MVHFEAADIHSLLYGWKEGVGAGPALAAGTLEFP